MVDERVVPSRVRVLHRGRVFTVQVESITLPSGHRLDAEIVRHPGSVIIIPITDQDEILLVRQYRHAIGRSAWELPAGSLEPGEDPDAAAVRECHEETGLIPTRVERCGSFFPTPGYCDEEMHFYVATGLRTPASGDAAAHPDEDEDIQTRAFSKAAMHAMVRAGEIVDLKTVAGLALAEAGRAEAT
jgi:ADP-ribose pyrophosphatase